MYEIQKRKLINAIELFFGSGEVYAEKRNVQPDGSILIDKELKSPNRTEEVLRRLRELSVVICGGAVNSIFTGNSINDLDFYVAEPSKLEEARSFLLEWFPEKTFVTQNAISAYRKSGVGNKRYRMQLVTRFTGPPEKIFDTFDFTIVAGAYDFASSMFVLHDRFLTDIARRRLVYMGGSAYPICAMWRTQKYQKRGYTVPGSTIMHIALSIVQLDIKSYKQLKEQLMGIDTMYLQNVLGGHNFAENLPVDYGQFISTVFENIEGPIDEAERFEDEE